MYFAINQNCDNAKRLRLPQRILFIALNRAKPVCSALTWGASSDISPSPSGFARLVPGPSAFAAPSMSAGV